MVMTEFEHSSFIAFVPEIVTGKTSKITETDAKQCDQICRISPSKLRHTVANLSYTSTRDISPFRRVRRCPERGHGACQRSYNACQFK